MDLKDFDINKIKEREKLSKVLSVRVTKSNFEWIKKNKISATKLFNYALRKVKEKESNKK